MSECACCLPRPAPPRLKVAAPPATTFQWQNASLVSNTSLIPSLQIVYRGALPPTPPIPTVAAANVYVCLRICIYLYTYVDVEYSGRPQGGVGRLPHCTSTEQHYQCPHLSQLTFMYFLYKIYHWPGSVSGAAPPSTPPPPPPRTSGTIAQFLAVLYRILFFTFIKCSTKDINVFYFIMCMYGCMYV